MHVNSKRYSFEFVRSRLDAEYNTFKAEALRNSCFTSVTMPILVSLSTFNETHILLCSASARVKRSFDTQS